MHFFNVLFHVSCWGRSFNILSALLIYLFLRNCDAKLTSQVHDQHLVIENVRTYVDVSTQVVKLDHKLSFVSSVKNLRSFIYYVDPLLINNLANFTAYTKNAEWMDLDDILQVKYHDVGVWQIYLNKVLSQGERDVIRIRALFTHVLKPFPSQVTQHDKHLVLYSGPISFYSPYDILNHTSYINTGDGPVGSVKVPPGFVNVNGSPVITIISHNLTQKKYIESYAEIHYEHVNVFLTVNLLIRTIEISHWGSISVRETIELENSGAKFTGPFHRPYLDLNDPTVVKSITTFLPVSASDISVYDDVGNISSTRLRELSDSIEMIYRPRFVLYGGWKIKYNLYYNVPSYEYLFNKNDKFILKMRTIDHIFNEMVIDKAIVKIILPEGSKIDNIKTPYPVQFINDSYHVSYLDTVGRPVLTFMKEDLIEDHIEDFLLSYTFSKYKMLFEPFYVILFIEFIFIVFIVSKRIDFSLTDESYVLLAEKAEKIHGESNVVSNLVKTSSSIKFKKKRH